jgi:hypothetical protein
MVAASIDPGYFLHDKCDTTSTGKSVQKHQELVEDEGGHKEVRIK